MSSCALSETRQIQVPVGSVPIRLHPKFYSDITFCNFFYHHVMEEITFFDKIIIVFPFFTDFIICLRSKNFLKSLKLSQDDILWGQHGQTIEISYVSQVGGSVCNLGQSIFFKKCPPELNFFKFFSSETRDQDETHIWPFITNLYLKRQGRQVSSK